ncbi:HK97-gp10 family putative phage morphogenesis protein [Clostridium butyricum]|uniref:HK97-gp10 family putative phage morphogenesis protein n=1 Tax=Clostridium butyricum TaxID=1492 RepID=UPI00129C06AA|nr:HK97-gp10 family putative phage morphogenesis protein [Clostridium butyricum]QGH20231.1 HK97 gp10 family phage protein [Clostridium butyricum]QGH24266.1 HK97 gp10 family phage protein [Clostridium butyricum]
MARIELEGMQEIIDKVNKLGVKGEVIKKKALNKAGDLVKSSMEKKAPVSRLNKKHMADNIKISDIEKENGVDFIEIGPNKGDNSEFFYSKFSEWGTSTQPAQHWAENSILENKREINETIMEELKRGLEE